VVVVDDNRGCRGGFFLIHAEPGEFEGFLEVFVFSVVGGVNGGDFPSLLVDLLDHEVAPVDEGGVLALLQRLCIHSVNDDFWPGPNSLLSNIRVFGVARGLSRRQFCSGNPDWHIVHFVHSCVPWNDGVDNFLVQSPDLVPLHEHDRPAAALRDDELLESLHGETSPENSPHGGKTWIVPTVNNSFIHQPGQLTFRHHRICEIESGVGPDVRLTNAECVNEPVELVVPVHVLRGPEGVGDSLHAVHDGAGEVVGGVHLVLEARGGVLLYLAAVDRGIPHTPVVRLHVHLGSHGALQPNLRPLLHLLPHLHVLLHAVVTVLRLLPSFTFNLHSLRIRVINVSLADLDELIAVAHDGVEMIRCPREVIVADLQQLQILQDHLLILLLLFSRISIVESHDEFSLEGLLVVVVEKSRLGVAHVKEATGLWWEPHHNLPHLCSGQFHEFTAGTFFFLLLGHGGWSRSLSATLLRDSG